MRIGSKVYTVDWKHLLVISAATAASLAYLVDARSASLNIQNLLLVQPVVLVVLGLYLAILPQCFVPTDRPALEPDEEIDETAPAGMGRIMAVMVALGAFAFGLDVVGFDVSTFLFIAVVMAICGERSPLRLIAFPLGMTLFVIYSLKALVSFPLPTTFL